MIFWTFLERLLTRRGRSLTAVADELGFGELARLWKSGAATPHLSTKYHHALERMTGLPWQLLGFLIHSGDEREVTVSEAEALAAATDRRYHASLSPRDYSSMLDELRHPRQLAQPIQLSDCEFCGTESRKPGRCPDCMRVNGASG